MKASWEKIEKNHGVLTIEVEADQVSVGLDKAFKKVSAKANIPGFRKGKVPRSIFEAKFGVESLYQDALDILLPEAYSQAVKETGINPIDRPEVDVQQMEKGQPLKFTAKVEVKPEVQLGEYKGLEIADTAKEVTTEELEAELTKLQQRHAELIVVEEGQAENGDSTIIDFDGYLDGVAFEGGKGERHALELGSNSFIPGFEDQVVGMGIGDDKDIEVTFPEDYQAEELKGKAVVFKVKLHEIKRKNLPALDDEFAKDVSEFDTLEEFKVDLSKRLAEKNDQTAKRDQENQLVELVAASADVAIPQVMVDAEVELMLNDFANRLKSQGMTLEMYFQFSGQDESVLKAQMSGDAEKRVRNNLVLEAVAKAEGIEVTDEELTEELDKMAQTYKRTIEDIRSILEANGNLESMKLELVVKKTIDFLLANSKVVPASA
ncbi:trigger factor [Paenibacillus psychroresistens]|uniref:Trigger factor n=1 Tax=Paenibacillus psychroresistens TaxID=1778678 RepID=A0A6B8RIG1_9BACL|nr:trigger factor [Paenibacillus psychroresistens]QGQ95352.1 trigger factor [Paenibacillus psychroresistens]